MCVCNGVYNARWSDCLPQDKDIRIILAYMYEDKALNTTCQAIHLNLTTENHLWIFPAWYPTDWWNQTVYIKNRDPCTPDMMREAVMYSIYLDSYNETLNKDIPADSGLTIDEFLGKYEEALEEFRTSGLYYGDDEPHHYATFAYDAVWTMALALHRASQVLERDGVYLHNFTYSNTLGITENITKQMSTPSFRGISGEIAFDVNGSRLGHNGIYQLVPSGDGESLDLKLLYVQNPHQVDSRLPMNLSEWLCEPRWKGDGPPHDRRQPDTKYLDPSLIYACDFFISVAIIVAVGLLVFNLATIWKPLIRDSAPIINAIIICGCLLMLVTCYLLGVDTRTPTQDGDNPSDADEDNTESGREDINQQRNSRYADICILRLWLFTLGFSLSFGALFAKTWQVYRVYTNPKLKKQPFKMWNFLIILGVFLFIDVLYLSIWTGAFPFERALAEIENDAEDTLEVFEKCVCDNFNYLIGALYVYKGLLVVFGLFLAYESRNVKYYYINDSRFTSIAVYIVVIVVGIGAPLSLVLSEHLFIDPAYSLTVLMVILATMSCLLILFIPKFVYMAKGKETMVNENTREEVTAGDGLQLGRTSVDQTDMQTAEEEVRQLQERVEKKTSELHTLEDTLQSPTKPSPKSQCGSDGDSGVLVTTTDEQPEVFISETSRGTPASEGSPNNPSPTEENVGDEGL
jgi:gamma-aminobutyric acid type B receptor